jgi:hypothetical protein
MSNAEIQKQVERNEKREREMALLQAASTLLGPVVTDEERAVKIAKTLLELIEGGDRADTGNPR